MKRRNLLCGCLMLLMLLGTACSADTVNGITAKKGNGLAPGTPTHLSEKLGSDILIDADVTLPEGVRSVPVLTARPFKIDGGKLKSALIGNNKVIQQKNADGSTEMVTMGLQFADKSGKPILYGGVGKQANDRILMYGGDLTFFMTTEYNYIFYAFQHDSTSGAYSANQYKRKSLPFMAPADAFNDVVKTVGGFGLDVSGSHDIYCLDNETTQSINGLSAMTHYLNYISLGRGDLENKSEYSEHDDFYFFTLYPKYHGIPITAGDGLNIDGGALDVAYSERGIEYLAANTLYQETGVKQPSAQIYGLDGALQALRHKYEQTILANPVKITGIRLCYTPVPVSKNGDTVELVPTWNFDVSQTVLDINGNGVDSIFHSGEPRIETVEIYFDATTGKELIGSSPRI